MARLPSPSHLMTALCCHRYVQADGSKPVLAGDTGARRAVAFDNLLAMRAVALDGVGVATAARYFIGAELNHAHFRMQGFGAFDRAFDVGCLEAEHNVIVSVSLINSD